LQINSVTLSSIRSILRTGRDKVESMASLSETPTVEPTLVQPHQNIRGAGYYN
jgi:hypothetical protein